MDEMGGSIVLKAGMTFLVIFKKKSKKAFTKQEMTGIEHIMNTAFARHAQIGKCAYIAGVVNPEMFHPESENILAELQKFIDRLITGALQYLGIDDAAMAVFMIAPVFASSGSASGDDLFCDVEEILENQKFDPAGDDDDDDDDGIREIKPKTRADKWLDNLIDGLKGDD